MVYTEVENLEDQMEDGPTGFVSRKGPKWPYSWFSTIREKEEEEDGIKVGRTQTRV